MAKDKDKKVVGVMTTALESLYTQVISNIINVKDMEL